MGSTRADVRATYERIAESYAATRTRPWPQVLDFVSSLPSRCRVLDVGCGPGRHARPLDAAGHRVVGLDLSRRLLTVGRQLTPATRIDWLEGEATALPFRDATFDAAICVAVVHHLSSRDERTKALAELRRVLRRRGRAFISVWSKDNPYLQDVLGGRPNDQDVEIPWRLPDGSAAMRFYHLFVEGELDRMIIESGLHGERFFQGSGNYFAVATNHG